MRIITILSLCLPVLAARRHAEVDDAIHATASPAFTPSSPYPVATSSASQSGSLELRLVPIDAAPGALNDGTLNVAGPADPAVPVNQQVNPAAPLSLAASSSVSSSSSSVRPPVIVEPSSELAVAPAVLTTVSTPPAFTQAVPTTVSTPPAVTASPDLAAGFYTTTQWVETWLDSTSRTWLPVTITLRYKPTTTYPTPGKGKIGMGTLTGETGKTVTIVLGAAASQTAGVVRGVVAALGVGLVGMVV